MKPKCRTSRVLVASLAVLLPFGAACSADDDDGSAGTTSTTASGGGPAVRQPALEGTITVAASDSLVGALPELVDVFNASNPGVEVATTIDSTPALAMRLADGEPADVFMSSDQSNMGVVVGADRVDGTPQVMARNQLVLVTAPGNPDDITDLAMLAEAGEVALCEASTPCGALADQVLDGAGVDIPSSAVTRTGDAAEALAAVAEGRAVAALVYATTVQGSGDAVEVVTLTDAAGTVIEYPVAALAGTGNTLAARAFVDFLLGPEGAEILVSYGFLPPA